MEILVFGSKSPDCKNCRRAETMLEEIVSGNAKISYRKLALDAEEAKKFKVMVTPTIIINNKIIALGEVPAGDALREYIQGELKKEG